MKISNNKIIFLFSVILLFGCARTQKDASIKADPSIKPEIIDSTNKVFLGPEFAEAELEGFLKDSTNNALNGEVLINSKEKLILIAEPILFDIYGRQNILKERPYEIYLFGDYWIMMGTLPKGWKGGTFTIIINKKTCKVIGISHGK